MAWQHMVPAERQPSPRRSTTSLIGPAAGDKGAWPRRAARWRLHSAPRLGRAWRLRLIGVAPAALVAAGCGQAAQGPAASSPAARAGTVLPAGDVTATQHVTQPGVPTRPNPRPDCPRLASVFRQLLEAPDPAAFAARRVPGYKDGRVEVSIQLTEAGADLTQRYGLQVVARTPTLIEAYAPLPQLCDLSNDSRVLRVDPTQHSGF